MNTKHYSSSDFSSNCWSLFLISYWAFPYCALPKILHLTSLKLTQYLSTMPALTPAFLPPSPTLHSRAPMLPPSRSSRSRRALNRVPTQLRPGWSHVCPRSWATYPALLSLILRLFLMHPLRVHCFLSCTALSLLCFGKPPLSSSKWLTASRCLGLAPSHYPGFAFLLLLPWPFTPVTGPHNRTYQALLFLLYKCQLLFGILSLLLRMVKPKTRLSSLSVKPFHTHYTHSSSFLTQPSNGLHIIILFLPPYGFACIAPITAY